MMNSKAAIRAWALALCSLAGACGGGGGGGGVLTTLSTDLPSGTVVRAGMVLEFTVTSTHETTHSVRLNLLNPPSGCVVETSSTSGSNVARVRWLVPSAIGGLRQLQFKATDDTDPSRTLALAVDIRIDGSSKNILVQFGDVTGDGILDTVGVATRADVAGVADGGAIYVWFGSASPTGVPDATLSIPGVTAADQLCRTPASQGIQLGDVTGDGVLDIIAIAPLADVGGVSDAGALFVWKGGATLTGTPAPDATLSVPGAVAGDGLGLLDNSQPFQLVDLDDDGLLDVVSGSSHVDIGPAVDAGAIYVWMAGPGMSGSVDPSASLAVPGTQTNDLLGSSSGEGVQFADVTGDGLIDVIAGSPTADVAGVINAGAVYVWSGSSLNGAPLATLSIPGALMNDNLSQATGRAIQIADVTGDGELDVVVAANVADAPGFVDAGALYAWAGGATLTGTPAPVATLVAIGPHTNDRLADITGDGFRLADVTGDGRLDVIAGSDTTDVGGVTDAGAMFVWKGGPTLTGVQTELATLTLAGAVAADRLGNTTGEGLQIVDVTGDGILDVVSTSFLADVGGVVDAGAVYVWKGGATLTGALTAFATLTVPGAIAGDRLGQGLGQQGIQLADVTGDGVPDVIGAAANADVAGVVDVGAVYVWQGGSTLTGTPALYSRLEAPGAIAGDRLGAAGAQGILFGDVTHDGLVDVVVGTVFADVAGVVDAGVIYVWNGGAALGGAPAPLATLSVPGAVAMDKLGIGTPGLQLVDVTGDGRLDVLAGSSLVDLGGLTDIGAVYLWAGGATLTGSVSPGATLAVPAAVAGDGLGNASGQGLHFADITGDGVLDVVTGTQASDVGIIMDAGSIELWSGGAGLTGSPAPSSRMSVASAVDGDGLGS